MGDTADEDRPLIESRRERMMAYLRYNGPKIAVDAAVLAAWLLVTTSVFRWVALPQWLLYVVVFVGVGMYAWLTPAWKRPYRSPDP